MLELANEGFILSTDLAVILLKNIYLSEKHVVTTKIVNFMGKKMLNCTNLLWRVKKNWTKLRWIFLKVFNLRNSVNSKKSYGGTSFVNIKKMIKKYKRESKWKKK